MDEVAGRAETSKRSLYAHFENKEKLFLVVIDLVRGLFLSRLRMPGDYSEKLAEALAMFCARYLKTAFGLSARASAEAAHRLLGQILYPRFSRALFGMDRLAASFDREALAPDFDLKPIRRAVTDLIESLQKQ